MAQGSKGKVVQVIGTVVDVEFPPEDLPEIYNGLELDVDGERLVLEVEQHVGNNWARCLALGTTDGLARGAECIDTGQPVAVPVGENSLGRIFNVLGDAIDGGEQVASDAERLANSPPAALIRRAVSNHRDFGDRHQGFGSDHALPAWW